MSAPHRHGRLHEMRRERCGWNIDRRRLAMRPIIASPLMPLRNTVQCDRIQGHRVACDPHPKKVPVAVKAHRAEGVVVIEIEAPRGDVEIEPEQDARDHAADQDQLCGEQ